MFSACNACLTSAISYLFSSMKDIVELDLFASDADGAPWRATRFANGRRL